jgi:EAL domain-containing protein (putative c-di-GMP-specific phosphodiesterase class I)/ActR/RegA family two-component response regulator
VGEWVIRAACAQIKAWKDAGIQPAPVAVNLSARQFQSPDLGTMIGAMLDEFKLEPQLLELEITEGSLMHNTEDAVRTLKHLEALGLRISIDDFGTGYSSLAYLKRFPLHALKIDRAFVKDIGQDSDDTAITLALISMAHNLGLKVIAEGVETEEQLTFLSANGCDEIQGYYFAEPLAAGECTEFLRQKKRLPRLTQRRNAQPASILLVDDDEDALLLLKRILSSNEYEILIATSARQALKMLSEHNVKVVVSDQQMPGMSGVEFLQRVRSLFPDTVRVMLSGHTEFETVSNAINKGEIFRFLAKSWDKEQLRRDIREAFELGMSGRGKLVSIKGGRPTAA